MFRCLSLLSIGAAFRKDENGSAMTEYLLLLAILAAGVASAITIFGGGMSSAVDSWSTFISATTPPPAAG